MASNDPVAPEARKPHLSAEDAEQFASQIRPSWELLDFEGQLPDLGVPIESPLLKARAAPPAGATSAPDTVIDGVPTFAVSGSSVPVSDKPIQPLPIAAIGAPAASDDVPVDEDIPVDALPLPPQRIDLDGKPDGKGAPTRKSTIIGGVEAPTSPAPAAAPLAAVAAMPPVESPAPVAPAPAGPSRSPMSSRRAVAPASGPSPASAAGRSRPGVTGADDEIVIPIAGPPKGLFVKIGAGAGALIALAIGLKVLLGSSDKATGATPVATSQATANATASAAPTAPATTAATPPPPPPVEPPAQTAAATASATPSAAPVATTKPKADPPPVEAPKPPPAAKTPPPTKTTPPPPPPKKGGGIIRETPF